MHLILVLNPNPEKKFHALRASSAAPFPSLMLGPMPAPGEIPGAPGGRSQAQTAAGPQLHAAGRTEPTGPGTAAPIALSQPGGGCRRAHLQGARTAAGRCHEVTAVRKAARNWQPAAGGGARARWAGAGKNAIPQRACPRPRGVSWRRLSISERCSCSTLPVWGRRRACPPLAQLTRGADKI